MKNKFFEFDISPNYNLFVFSFFILKPKSSFVDVFLLYKEKKYLIARFEPDLQQTFSLETEYFSYKVDELHIHEKINNKVFLELSTDDADSYIHSSIDGSYDGFKIEKFSQAKANFFPIRKYMAQFSFDHMDFARICLPSSLYHALQYLYDKDVRIMDILKLSYDQFHKIYGNWSLASYAVYNSSNKECFLSIFFSLTIEDLKILIYKFGFVMVSIKGELKGAYKPFYDGHLIILTSINDECVECLDSATDDLEKVKKEYCIKEFLAAWTRRNNVTFIFQKKFDMVVSV